MRVVVLTGASASGKTTIATAVGMAWTDSVAVYHFDAVGVPSPDAMTAGWGSSEEWQRATTFAWLKRIASECDCQSRPALLEGQMRIAFIREALVAAGLTDARVVLVDCDDETRTRRLVHDRQQPEFCNDTMKNWAAYLRDEAYAANVEVIDTTRKSFAECVRSVVDRLSVVDKG